MDKRDNPKYFSVEVAYKKNEDLPEENNFIKYDRKVILETERKLGLTFIAENARQDNLCMANSEEVRTDFRTTFSDEDFTNYIEGWLMSFRSRTDKSLKFLLIQFPHSIDKFWKLVKVGKNKKEGN